MLRLNERGCGGLVDRNPSVNPPLNERQLGELAVMIESGRAVAAHGVVR